MGSRADDSVGEKMEELRLVCDREIPIQQRKIDLVKASFSNLTESIKFRSRGTLEKQENLRKLKVQLREAEDNMVRVLAAKTRKEAKQMAKMDSISATKSRIEELKRIVQDQRARKEEYTAIISQLSLALAASEMMHNQESKQRSEIEEAISWYNRVLGFRIECGHGVKFVFTNINLKNPDEEYSLTIRHANDMYILLDCDPQLNDTKELINELNKTNGLFKFVRIMREKFQESSASGLAPQSTFLNQEHTVISAVSAPVSSVSTDSKSESPVKKDELQVQPVEAQRCSTVHDQRGTVRAAARSPGSASSLRRSPRFKRKIQQDKT